jgi:hypothetical protein
MKGLSVKSVLGLVIALALTTSLSFGYSFWSHKSNVKSTRISLGSTMKLANGTILRPGSYRMEVPENTKSPRVVFYQNGKVVAKSKVKLVSEATKNPDTEIDSVKSGKYQLVTKIHPAGWQEVLVFSNRHASSKT